MNKNKMKCRQQSKQLHEFNDAQLNFMAGCHRMVTSLLYYTSRLLLALKNFSDCSKISFIGSQQRTTETLKWFGEYIMLKYKDLTPGQKRCVDAYLAEAPELKKKRTITFKEISRIHYAIHDKRGEGAPKIGYPNWMIAADNKVERGVYWFPSPDASALGPRAAKKLEEKAPKASEAPEETSSKANEEKAKRTSKKAASRTLPDRESAEAILQEIRQMLNRAPARRGRPRKNS